MANDQCELLCLDLPHAEMLRKQRLAPTRVHELADRFRALSDPTRLTIALVLQAGGEVCVCDLSWIVERGQNLVSHHLRSLRGAGLVDYRREGKMALYSLTEHGRLLLDRITPAQEIAR
jgi:DNA-binding transcriptional ArsR family regulator